MRGRYGQALVIGTLLGSKKARLKDIGATSYNCYGQLENRTEADLRILISQMIRMGYIQFFKFLVAVAAIITRLMCGFSEVFQDVIAQTGGGHTVAFHKLETAGILMFYLFNFLKIQDRKSVV